MIKTEKKIEKLKKNYRKRMKTKKRCNAIIGRSMAYIENIRKMSTKNLKPKTSEKPLENLWFLVFEHIRNMSTRVRFSKTF